ncbi:hypothetical protein ACFFWC_20245 [Plantactinospora siamensis]|uniref:Uncharacterized protein n=1 Tax=Plantactinospora siamensis TaxID=555372 RepID=A0ABV6P2V5_9ACTN
MTEPVRIADLPAALAARTFPTVTRWNRLEGRPRSTDFDRALRAEIRDPLWMLTRQWQLGEFRGEDAGSPVTATYSVAAAPLSGTADRPIEAAAERRQVPFAFGADPLSYDLRLAIGRRWLKLLDAAPPLRRFRQDYVDHYPIAAPDPAADADTARVAHPEVWAQLQAVAGRRMDGYALYRHIVDGGHAYDGIANVNGPFRGQLDTLGGRLVAWFTGLIDQPTGAPTWDPRRLEHRFSVTAGGTTLTAPEHPGGTVDWHSFSVTGTAAPTAPTVLNRTVFPAPVRFSGMPLPRWWAVEDGRTNFAAVQPDSTDVTRLVFLEFALVFSNDWYLLPCDLPAVALAEVQGLAVTDVFGERRWITAAGTGEQQGWQRWAMYALGAETTDTLDRRLLLPATAPQIATGPALEDVSLIRDENANLVWGIERTIRLATGEGRRGSEVVTETLAQQNRLHPPPPPDAPHAPIAYEAMNTIPEHWIPFLPVHVPGDTRSVQLQRAALPSSVDGRPIRPHTALLREGLDTAPARPYFINEEEVPATGTVLSLAFRRTRGPDGRVSVWLGARRGTGRGEGSSGLAFDITVPTAPADR